MAIYGNKIEASQWTPPHSVIGEVESTAAGNVVLRVGSQTRDGNGWVQTTRITLTEREVIDLIADLEGMLP